MYRYWKIVWKNFRLQLLYIPFLKHLNFCQLFWMCFKVFLRSFTNPFDIENSHFRCEIFLFFSCFMLYLHILNPLENCSYIHKRVIWNSLHRTAFRLCTHIIHVYGKITKALPYILNKSNYNTYYVHERYITKYKEVGKLWIYTRYMFFNWTNNWGLQTYTQFPRKAPGLKKQWIILLIFRFGVFLITSATSYRKILAAFKYEIYRPQWVWIRHTPFRGKLFIYTNLCSTNLNEIRWNIKWL